MSYIPSMTFAGATLLVGDQLREEFLHFGNGIIHDDPGEVVDLSGYYVFPGIIDLHGDGFERHIAPRPTAPFDIDISLKAAQKEYLSNGVTTAYLAQSWSWEGGRRSPNAALALMAELSKMTPSLICDMRVQLRFETALIEDKKRILDAIDAYHLDYLVFNYHLDQALEIFETRPEILTMIAQDNNRSLDEHMDIIRHYKQNDPKILTFLTEFCADLKSRGVSLGSHDDDTHEKREIFSNLGARLCEFPTNIEPATLASENGEAILMGAPNVVRGGSQIGRVSALELIKAGLCDVLVSDYFVPSLALAAWSLADRGVCSLAQSWNMISRNAAMAKRLPDRGTLDSGKRADLVVIDKSTRNIEGVIAAGRIGFAQGEFMNRLMNAKYASAASE